MGKPSPVFPQHCRQNDSTASTREHTSPLLWILISLRVKVQISPMVWALLPVHLQLSPTLPPAHSQLFPWSHQAYCHLHSAHLVSTPRFSVDSLLTLLRSPTQMLHLVRFPDFPAWNSNLHSPLILAPPSLPIPSASLFYCIATYYHEPAIHWHVFIICIIWRKYILHEIKSFKKIYCSLSCHAIASIW